MAKRLRFFKTLYKRSMNVSVYTEKNMNGYMIKVESGKAQII